MHVCTYILVDIYDENAKEMQKMCGEKTLEYKMCDCECE